METIRNFAPDTDRYAFDFRLCTPAKGFAQVDTSQDASYFGTWASARRRIIVNFCEGDITVEIAANDEEFAAAIRKLVDWNERNGWGPAKIDVACNETLKAEFERVGLADLIH